MTNFSTGALGLVLSAALARAGCEVLCFKGETASAHGEPDGVKTASFSTNGDLLRKLEAEAGRADAIFHAAALCDFRMKTVHGEDGLAITAAKIPTRAGGLILELEPAPKVLPLLRPLFPNAKIVGWKYELDGTCDDVLDRASRQIAECATDACVVNGDAWGVGFGFLETAHPAVPLATKEALAEFLIKWVGK
jgi:phosphopantothenoylcysteine synthetase/decarboxylase